MVETEILPAYLPKRRWFASKGERLRGVRVAYAVRLPREQRSGRASPRSRRGCEDRVERYALPLGGWEEDAPDR